MSDSEELGDDLGMEGTGRQKIRTFDVVVTEVIRETADTSTIVLFAGGQKIPYLAGQFITIRPEQFPALERFCAFFRDVKGKPEPPRAYSLYSSPHEADLSFTVKAEEYVSGLTEYPPLLSPFLTYRLTPGTRMTVRGIGGPYAMDRSVEEQTDHVVHICAGSGIVPNMSMIKWALATDLNVHHTLIYGNKTWSDIIYRKELEELEKQHPDKLRVLHTISREKDVSRYGANYRVGRVGEEMISEVIRDPNAVAVFTCGPAITPWDRKAAKAKGVEPTPRFLETTLAALKAIGLPKDRLHRESYG
ncbi:MAG: oxidoreductase [Thermoanaerobaculia bacterium]